MRKRDIQLMLDDIAEQLKSIQVDLNKFESATPRQVQRLTNYDSAMTPYELVCSQYELPFPLYEFQINAVNDLAPLPRSGWWLDMGTGKTITSIVATLFKMTTGEVTQCIVLMPPILLTNWSRTLSGIKGTSHQIYRGSPKQRADMVLDKRFILMSYQIFVKDNERLCRDYSGKRTNLICDESTMVKNCATGMYKKVRDWSMDSCLMLLSGSPLSTPHDGYAPIKLVSPSIYRNLNQYEQIHIAERDFFGHVYQWANLDLLNDNLLINAVRVLRTDVIKDLPAVTYTPMYYELDKAHARAYQRLCDEQILKFSNEAVEKPQFSQTVRVRRLIANLPSIPSCVCRQAPNIPSPRAKRFITAGSGVSPAGCVGHCVPNHSKRIAVMRQLLDVVHHAIQLPLPIDLAPSA